MRSKKNEEGEGKEVGPVKEVRLTRGLKSKRHHSMELLAYHEQKTTWRCGGESVLVDILGEPEMKDVLEGQQAEITIPFLISNDET